MAKRPRAPARRGCATQTAQRSRKSAKKAASKTASKTKSKPKTKTTGKQTYKTEQKPTFAQTRQASLSRRRIYTPEFLAYARQRFEQTEDLLADIGQDLGISSESVRLLAKREGWKRYVRPPHGLPPAVKRAMQAEVPDHQPQEQSGATRRRRGGLGASRR